MQNSLDSTTYICILRGINVSGQKIIKMEALKELCIALHFQNIQTYIQSGNIVFQTKKTASEELEKEISKGIATKFGFDVPVILIELTEWEDILSANPFLKDETKDNTYFHISFLSKNPSHEDFTKIEAVRYAPDEFYLVGRAIYLYCPNGYGNSKLTNNFFEHKLNLVATTRNWKTSNELLRIAKKIACLRID